MAKKQPIKALGDLSMEDLTPEEREQVAAAAADAESIDESANQIDEILKSNDLAGGLIRLERRGPKDNGFAYICKIKIDQFDIDHIKKMYGGGDYIGKTWRADGRMYKSIQFSIDPRIEGILGELPKGAPAAQQTDPVALMTAMHGLTKDDGKRAQEMQMVLNAQKEQQTLLMTIMQESQKSQQAMVTAMMQAMAAARPAQSDSLSVKDLITLLPTLIPLLKGEKPVSAPSILDTIEALKGMKELVGNGTIAPEPPEPKTVMEQILGALPHAASIVANLRGQPQPAPVATPRALPQPAKNGTPPSGPVSRAVGAPPTAPAAATPAPTPAADPQQERIAKLLETLVNAARRNRDVDLYCDLVLEELEDSEVPMFTQVLTSDTWFTSLFGNLPDAAILQPWFTNLRTLLLESLTDQPANGSPESTPVATPPAAAGGTDSSGVRLGGDADGASPNP